MTPKQKNVVTWAFIAAGLGLSAYIIYELFFKKDPIQKDLAALKAKGIVPTITESNAQSFADQLDKILDSVFVSTSDLTDIFINCENLADVLLIIEKYGTRLHFSFTYFGEYSLSQYINMKASKDAIQAINSILFSKNINFKF